MLHRAARSCALPLGEGLSQARTVLSLALTCLPAQAANVLPPPCNGLRSSFGRGSFPSTQGVVTYVDLPAYSCSADNLCHIPENWLCSNSVSNRILFGLTQPPPTRFSVHFGLRAGGKCMMGAVSRLQRGEKPPPTFLFVHETAPSFNSLPKHFAVG